MNSNFIFILLTFIAVCVGGYVLLALARSGWRKIAGPSLVGIVLIAMCVTTVLAMGLPRPLWSFVASHDTYRMVGWTFIEGKAIFVWLAPENGSDPVVVQFPWSEQKASELQAEMMQLNQQGLDGQVNPGELARHGSGNIVTPF